MGKIRIYILHCFLALLYAAVSSTTLIAQLTLPAVSSGPIRVREAKGAAREPGKPSWTIRRHLPMVKDGSKCPVHVAHATVHHNPNEFKTFHFAERSLTLESSIHFSLSDRSPPHS